MSHPLLNYANIVVNNNFKDDFELTVFVTNYCNESCEHCFYASELNTKKPEFDTETFRKIAKTVPSYCRKLILAGGEPFMRNDLAEIVDAFHQNGVREFGIVTNGTMTSKIMKFVDKVKPLKRARVYVQVSIDGPEEYHDKIRKHKGAYKKAMETLRELKSRGVNTGVQTAISRSNFEVIKEYDQSIYDQLQIDVHYQFVRGAEVSGLPDKCRNSFDPLDKSLLPTNEEIKKYLDILKDIYANRIKTRGNLFRNAFAYTTLECKYIIGVRRTNIFPCVAGTKRGVLYPTGDAAVCEYFKSAKQKLQDFDYDFSKLWQSPEIREQDKIARNCYCTHGCYINIVGTGSFFQYLVKNIVQFGKLSLSGRQSSQSAQDKEAPDNITQTEKV